MNETPAIQVADLTKIYGSGHTEIVAVHEATLAVRHGELAALLGPSGGGKTTLLTAMALINPPTSGRVHIDGKLVMDGPYARVNVRTFRRQHIGYVFQSANLIPFLSARENVQIALELDGVGSRAARKRTLELLEYLGVAERSEHYMAALSGGEQQRVAVARSLANEPSVILADEPTASLDSQRGRQVINLFRKVTHERGAGVLVVTHDHRMLDLFDTIYEMEDGRVRVQQERGQTGAVKS
jgi:putative ABC transport system ATP-binding protein